MVSFARRCRCRPRRSLGVDYVDGPVLGDAVHPDVDVVDINAVPDRHLVNVTDSHTRTRDRRGQNRHLWLSCSQAKRNGKAFTRNQKHHCMYDAVLVPTDGSEGSATAAEHAIDLAQRHDARLYALHVLETEQVVDQIPEFEDSSIFDRLADAGQQAVDDLRAQAEDAGIDTVTTAVKQGVPHEEVVDYVERHDIDVVVMATEGRTGPSRELIGSVTESVVRASLGPRASFVGGEALRAYGGVGGQGQPHRGTDTTVSAVENRRPCYRDSSSGSTPRRSVTLRAEGRHGRRPRRNPRGRRGVAVTESRGDGLRQERNEVSSKIGELKQDGKDEEAQEDIDRSRNSKTNCRISRSAPTNWSPSWKRRC